MPEVAKDCYRVPASTGKPKKANLVLQALIELSNTGLTEAKCADPDLGLIKDMLNARPEWPLWGQVKALNAWTPTTYRLNTHN